MSYDSFITYRRPWDSYRGSQQPSSSFSSSFYSSCPPRAAPRRVTSSSSYSYSCSGLPDGAGRMDLAQASSLNTETLGLRAQEKEQLVGLNDRFATYIEKVHTLEQQRRALGAELEALRGRQSEPSRLRQLYETEVRLLRGRVDEESGDRARLEAEREHLREVRDRLSERYEEEARLRRKAEEALREGREEADRAAVAHCDAEAGVVSLAEEVLFLRKVFQEERVELEAQLEVRLQAASVAPDTEARPDLSAALREIRAQYERLAGRNRRSAEEWYRSKFAGVAEMATRNNEAVHAIREETVEYRRLLQSRSAEIEALRNVIGSLHKQLEALEDRQHEDVAKYQARINDLERDINEAKSEMTCYLRDYQDLLNVKMALDIEIAAYRKLLEVEECRLTCSSFN